MRGRWTRSTVRLAEPSASEKTNLPSVLRSSASLASAGFHDQVVRTCVASGDRDTAVMPVAMIADAPGPVGVEMQGGASRGTLRGIVENDPLLVER